MASLPVLVLNSGSSSIKFSVYGAGDGEPRKLHEGAVDGIGTDQGEFWITDAKGKSWSMRPRPCLPGPLPSNWWRMRCTRKISPHHPPSATEWSRAALQFRQTNESLPH